LKNRIGADGRPPPRTVGSTAEACLRMEKSLARGA